MSARDRTLDGFVHDVASHEQLLARGWSASAIRHAVASGRLHPRHRGVYAIGRPDLTPAGRGLAAVLAVGPGAALSHRSAGAVWGIVEWDGPVEVTAPRRRRSRPGLAVHCSPLPRAHLPPAATNVRMGRWEVDLLWAERRLAVELDGFAYHRGRAASERDRRKDADLQAAGLRVLRITERAVRDEPFAVVARLAAMLGA